jgi:DNA-binding NarL/FixJ family response regulator
VTAVRARGSNRPGDYRRPSVRVKKRSPGVAQVLIVHDHEWLSSVLEKVLEGSAELVGQTLFGQVALVLSELLSPDVVVAGDVLGDGLVDQFLPVLLRTGTRVIVLAEPLSTNRMLDLVSKGVSGIVDMDVSPRDLAEAVISVVGGGAVLPPAVIGAIASEWRLSRRLNGTARTPSDHTRAGDLGSYDRRTEYQGPRQAVGNLSQDR